MDVFSMYSTTRRIVARVVVREEGKEEVEVKIKLNGS